MSNDEKAASKSIDAADIDALFPNVDDAPDIDAIFPQVGDAPSAADTSKTGYSDFGSSFNATCLSLIQSLLPCCSCSCQTIYVLHLLEACLLTTTWLPFKYKYKYY